MVTVLVVKTGLCVASGIVPASTFAAGGSLVPAAGELVLEVSAACRPATKAINRIQLCFFIHIDLSFASGKMRFRPLKRKPCVEPVTVW